MPAAPTNINLAQNTNMSCPTNGSHVGVTRDAFSMSAINTQPNNPFVPVANSMPSSQQNVSLLLEM